MAKWEYLVGFFGSPAEHWKHLLTTNVIESRFAPGGAARAGDSGRGLRDQGPADGGLSCSIWPSSAGTSSAALICFRWWLACYEVLS